MRHFGLAIVGRAVADATFSQMMRPYGHALAIVHAAHGAEILIKARIAQEHPLLIFNRLPLPGTTSGMLTVGELFEHGRSVEYDELPNLLWATTGYRLTSLQQYKDFGRLRNKIMHFAVPRVEHSVATLAFCVQVVEPMVHDFWEISALAAADQWDDATVGAGYLADQLRQHKIEPPECAKKILQWDAPEEG